MKKILNILLIMMMLMTMAGCGNKNEDEPIVEEAPIEQNVEENVEKENLPGGWAEVTDKTITDELKDIFSKALEGLMGASYEPLELVATQVVAGTNYRFLAKGTKTTNPVTNGTYYVEVYKDLSGNVSLLNIETIEEKQEEDKQVAEDTQDVTKMYFWAVFYDENDNELQREALLYGTTPVYKGELPDGFVEWTYKKTGEDVGDLSPIKGNTYYKAVCEHKASPRIVYRNHNTNNSTIAYMLDFFEDEEEYLVEFFDIAEDNTCEFMAVFPAPASLVGSGNKGKYYYYDNDANEFSECGDISPYKFGSEINGILITSNTIGPNESTNAYIIPHNADGNLVVTFKNTEDGDLIAYTINGNTITFTLKGTDLLAKDVTVGISVEGHDDISEEITIKGNIN